MSKRPWAKYFFSILGVAIVITLVAKYISATPLFLIPLTLGLYWLFVRGFTRLKGY